jgi:predicted Zn-ribbon and HTH transcriptional regulator
MEQTTETLQRILYQLKVFHEDLLEKHVHKPSSRCPLCRDEWLKLKRQQDVEKEDDRKDKDHATIG